MVKNHSLEDRQQVGVISGEPTPVTPPGPRLRIDPAPVEDRGHSARELVRTGRHCRVGGAQRVSNYIQDDRIDCEWAAGRKRWYMGVDVWQTAVRIRQTGVRARRPAIGGKRTGQIGVRYSTRYSETDRRPTKPSRQPITKIRNGAGNVSRLIHAAFSSPVVSVTAPRITTVGPIDPGTGMSMVGLLPWCLPIRRPR